MGDGALVEFASAVMPSPAPSKSKGSFGSRRRWLRSAIVINQATATPPSREFVPAWPLCAPYTPRRAALSLARRTTSTQHVIVWAKNGNRGAENSSDD